MRLQNRLGRKVFTSVLNPVYLERELITADVAIGAIHSKSGRAPMIVSEDMVRKMKPGAVIVDVSIDQGGCFEPVKSPRTKSPLSPNMMSYTTACPIYQVRFREQPQ